MLHPHLTRLGIQWDAGRQEVFVRMEAPHEHLCITPPRTEDASDVARILNIDSVHQGTLSIPHPFPIEAAMDWQRRLLNASGMWAEVLLEPELSSLSRLGGLPFDTIRTFIDAQDTQFVGNISLQIENNRKSRAVKDIRFPEPAKYIPGDLTLSKVIWRAGYYIDPSFSGRGITTAALQRLLRLVDDLTRLADSNAGCPTVRAAIWDDNIASKRILEKCGFQFALAGFETKDDQLLPYTRLERQGSAGKTKSF